MQQEAGKAHKSSSLDKWRCPKCSFDNLELMPTCEMCEEPRQRSPKKLSSPKDEKINKEPGIICPKSTCQHFNSLTADVCQKCGNCLFPESDEDYKKDAKADVPKKELSLCRSCGFENDPTNEFCVNCEKRFIPKRIPRKSALPRKKARRAFMMGGVGSTSPCPTCGETLRIIDYSTGETDICMKCESIAPSEVLKALCNFCDQKIAPDEAKHHDEKCEARLKFFDHSKNPTFDRCTPLQYDTMYYMHKKCQKLHFRKEKQLIDRIRKLGYSQKDLENLHHYIIHYAPIIIHMHVNTHFHFFLKDTHYRNQFQTAKSSGSLSTSARTNWEDRMFDHRHHDATGFQRVKYGTMNFTNDPRGVRACAGYGQSYFLLKDHVRDRCTITDMDSSSSNATLGTFRFIFHLLMKLSDAELHSAFEGSKGKEMKSNVIGAYKEIQIHGPVQFAKDIERLYISKDELKMGDAKAILEQVKSFCSKHSLDYELFENQKAIGGGVVFGFGGAVGGGAIKSEQRIVGDKKQLTEEELRPPPPAPVHAGGMFGGGGFFGGSIFGGGYVAPPPPPSLPASSYGVSHFAFGAPVAFGGLKKSQKKKEYGVDYI